MTLLEPPHRALALAVNVTLTLLVPGPDKKCPQRGTELRGMNFYCGYTPPILLSLPRVLITVRPFPPPPPPRRQVIDLDNQWRACRGRIDDLNKAKNLFQKEVTKAKKAGGEDPENAAKIKETVKEIKTVEVSMGELS